MYKQMNDLSRTVETGMKRNRNGIGVALIMATGVRRQVNRWPDDTWKKESTTGGKRNDYTPDGRVWAYECRK